MSHTCAESRTCRCGLTDLEPNESCPIHGTAWPPRCAECGRFMPQKDYFNPRDVAILGGDPSL